MSFLALAAAVCALGWGRVAVPSRGALGRRVVLTRGQSKRRLS